MVLLQLLVVASQSALSALHHSYEATTTLGAAGAVLVRGPQFVWSRVWLVGLHWKNLKNFAFFCWQNEVPASLRHLWDSFLLLSAQKVAEMPQKNHAGVTVTSCCNT